MLQPLIALFLVTTYIFIEKKKVVPQKPTLYGASVYGLYKLIDCRIEVLETQDNPSRGNKDTLIRIVGVVKL